MTALALVPLVSLWFAAAGDEPPPSTPAAPAREAAPTPPVPATVERPPQAVPAASPRPSRGTPALLGISVATLATCGLLGLPLCCVACPWVDEATGMASGLYAVSIQELIPFSFRADSFTPAYLAIVLVMGAILWVPAYALAVGPVGTLTATLLAPLLVAWKPGRRVPVLPLLGLFVLPCVGAAAGTGLGWAAILGDMFLVPRVYHRLYPVGGTPAPEPVRALRAGSSCSALLFTPALALCGMGAGEGVALAIMGVHSAVLGRDRAPGEPLFPPALLTAGTPPAALELDAPGKELAP